MKEEPEREYQPAPSGRIISTCIIVLLKQEAASCLELAASPFCTALSCFVQSVLLYYGICLG